MKQFASLLIVLLFCSCELSTSNKKNNPLNEDLIVVSDSISRLMSKYHYNHTELASNQYLTLQKKVRALAQTVSTKQEFKKGFNALWKDGPFSHVSLNMSSKNAKEMAAFFDTVRVGDQSLTLQWIDKTAVLTVNTMMGMDTKERVTEAYQEITSKEAKSLIIDLRNNEGGTFAGIPLASHILTDSRDVGIFVSKKWWINNDRAPELKDVQDLTPWEGWSLRSFWSDVQDQPLTRVKFKPMYPHFDESLYLLTSKKSASATEFTIDALAHEEKVTIIGETTAGKMLSQKMYDLPHGFQLALPIAEYYSTRIGRIEGKGVKPDIAIDQRVAMDLAFSLINGVALEVALAEVQQKISKVQDQTLGVDAIYLFGSMNDWGKNWDITPLFEYKGEGIYEANTKLNKGSYEFKIAPLDWSFDFGANPDQGNVMIGQKKSLAKVAGSNNLTIDLVDEVTLTFILDVSDSKSATLSILKNRP